jgi:hypothetical protein
MKRHLVSILISLGLILNHFALSNAAVPPKAGSVCSKVGISKNYQGKKFSCVRIGKKLVWDKGVQIKLANPKTSPTPTPTSPSNEGNANSEQSKVNQNPQPTISPSGASTPNYSLTDFKQSEVTTGSNECKLRDARIIKTQPNNSGFPISPDIIPIKGEARYLFIPIDFSDAPGTSTDLEIINSQIISFKKWFDFFSSGKLQVVSNTPNRWFRAPKPSTEYTTGKGCPNCANDFARVWNGYAQEFISSTGNLLNWTGIHGVIFHFPQAQKTDISHELLGRGVELQTPRGAQNLFYWASGNYHFNLEKQQRALTPDYWAALWVHEVLHSMGLSIHAPGNGFQTGVGQNQGGTSWVLSSWELFKLDWFSESQVYCLPKSMIASQTVFLQPIETPGAANKILIVPLDEFRAIIVESRRPVGYSAGWDSEDKGLLVYVLDTRNDNDRSKECCGDSGNDPKYSKWAYYMAADNKQVNTSAHGSKGYKDYIIRPLETVTFEGVSLKFIASFDVDVIEIKNR